jgi:hypothetical protein
MLPFWASRCFRREFLRVILALAARTASILVGRCFGCCVFAAFPTIGMIGSPCVGMIEPRSRGCMVIGPVDVGFLLGILNTARGSVRTPTTCMERRSAIKQRWVQTDLKFQLPVVALIVAALNVAGPGAAPLARISRRAEPREGVSAPDTKSQSV